ncbi:MULTISPECIES: FHA domain-containing protein [unclassified Streptomyces]|uniref:FHA domain-containing protein n=1 Tax=unclassified Streptomyces TaxID=2593676 RepID=UPI00382AF8A1
MAERPVTSTAPELVLETDTGSTMMSPGRDYHVGRDPYSDIVLDDSRVSWHHAVLRPEEGHWTLEDEQSANGTYADGRRIREGEVGPGTVIRFGSPADGPSAVLVGRPPTAPDRPSVVSMPCLTGTFRQPSAVRRLPARTLRIGRAPDNDVVLDDLTVSRHHAELRAHPDGSHEVVDLDSHNGTYLNGRAVFRAPLGPRDLVGIGHSSFCPVGGRLQEYVDTGAVSLDVQDLTVAAGRRILLDHVSFPLGEKCLLAVVGPSGAVRSALLGALTGRRPADHGTVLYDGRDLYRDHAELRLRIGLVPRDDFPHVRLTTRAVLTWTAELRFPEDTSKAERRERVEEVIRELGLGQHADQPVHSLSGGQRRRVGVALELLTKPSLLFLDEPTWGLGPGTDRSVTDMLRGLADDGRTVIVVSHGVPGLDVFDRLLVLAPGGRTAYFGPPGDALGFLGFEAWPEAFEAFERDTGRDRAEEFRVSSYHRKYVVNAGAQPVLPRAAPVPALPPPRPRRRRAQFSTLVRRHCAALLADRTFLAIMIGLPFVMGAAVRAVAGTGLILDPATDALLLLCVGAVLAGAADAVRDTLTERAFYQRERAVGLPGSAYVMSKAVVLGAVTVLQAVVLTQVGLAGVDLNAPGGGGVPVPPLPELTVAVAVLSFTVTMLGLLISALVRGAGTKPP